MVARADILAGRAVILVNIQDTVEAQLRSIRSKFRMFSNSMKEVGGDLFRGGLVGSVSSIFPVQQFIDFQDSILFLQSKLKDTGVDIVKLERYIRQLGATTSFTSKEVAEAAAVLAQAGLGKGVQPTLLPVLDLARGARIEMDTAGRILANIMSAFEINFEQADKVASKLITAARLGTLDVVDIGESLKESLTTFRQLGVPLEDALGLITQLSNVSLRATKAGTSLNTAFANLASKGEQLGELGIQILPEDMEDPQRIFAKLLKGFANLSKFEQVESLQSLFNIRGGRAFGGILVQDLEDLKGIIDQIKGSTNEARQAAELMDSRLGGVWRRAKSAFEESLLAVGGTSEGPLSQFGEIIARVFNDVSRLSTANPELVQSILLIGPASLAAGVGILGLTVIVGKLAMMITPLLMLNGVIFQLAAGLVGLNMKAFGGLRTGSAIGLKRLLPDTKELVKAEKRLAERQAAFDKDGSKRNATNLAKAQNRVADLRSQSIYTRPVNLISKVEVGVNRSITAISSFYSIMERVFVAAGSFMTRQSATLAKARERARLGLPGTVATLPDSLPGMTAAGLRQQTTSSVLSSTNLSNIMAGINPAMNPKTRQLPVLSGKFFQNLPITTNPGRRAGSGTQLGLPGMDQLMLDLSDPMSEPDWAKTRPKSFRDSKGKIVSKKLWEDFFATFTEFENLKLYKNAPLEVLLKDLFTAFDLSDETKTIFRQKLNMALSESLGGKQMDFMSVFDKQLPIMNPKFFPGVNIPSQKQLEFDFDAPLKPIIKWFQSAEDLFDVKTELPTVGKILSTLSYTDPKGSPSAYIDLFAAEKGAAKGAGKTLIKTLMEALSEFNPSSISGHFTNEAALGAFGSVLGKENVSFIERVSRKAAEISFEEAMKNPAAYIAKAPYFNPTSRAAVGEPNRFTGIDTAPGFLTPSTPTPIPVARLEGGKGANSFRKRLEEAAGPPAKVLSRRAAALKEVSKAFASIGASSRRAGVTTVGFTKILSVETIDLARRGLYAIGQVIKSGWNFTKSLDIIKMMYTGFSKVGTVVRTVFTGLNMIRRTIFSFSGILLIFEMLLLFGDRIPGIRDVFASLGKGFNALFSGLGKTIQDLIPAFQHMGIALKAIFTGDAQLGVQELLNSFRSMGAVIKDGVTSAWAGFMTEIKPGIEWLKTALVGAFTVLEGLFEAAAATVGAVFKTGKIVFTGEGDFIEVIKSAFSVENLKVFFSTILMFLHGVAQSLVTAVHTIAGVLLAIRTTFTSLLQGLAWAGNEDAQKTLNLLDVNRPRRQQLEDDIVAMRERRSEVQRQMTKMELLKLSGVGHGFINKAKLKDLEDEYIELGIHIARARAEMKGLPQEFNPIDLNLNESLAAIDTVFDKLQERIAGLGAPTPEDEPSPGINEGEAAGARDVAAANTGLLGQTAQGLGAWMAGTGLFNQPDTPLSITKAEAEQFGKGGMLIDEMRQGANAFLADPMAAFNEGAQTLSNTFPAVTDFLSNPIGSVTDFFTGGAKEEVSAVTSAIQANKVAIGKALVGSFSSTRGQTLQAAPALERLQEKSNEILEDIEENTALAAKQNEATFLA